VPERDWRTGRVPLEVGDASECTDGRGRRRPAPAPKRSAIERATVRLVRNLSSRVQLIICADARFEGHPFLTLPVPIRVPSLRTRTKELPRIIDQYAADAIHELHATEASFTAADREWLLEHAPLSVAEIERQRCGWSRSACRATYPTQRRGSAWHRCRSRGGSIAGSCLRCPPSERGGDETDEESLEPSMFSLGNARQWTTMGRMRVTVGPKYKVR
jgi:hypothetical protein